jgi:hypothetical protein
VGFIDFIIKPAFELLLKVLPKVQKNLDNVEINKTRWASLEQEYDPNDEGNKHHS